jgi:hypothetical protein
LCNKRKVVKEETKAIREIHTHTHAHTHTHTPDDGWLGVGVGCLRAWDQAFDVEVFGHLGQVVLHVALHVHLIHLRRVTDSVTDSVRPKTKAQGIDADTKKHVQVKATENHGIRSAQRHSNMALTESETHERTKHTASRTP